MGFLSCISRAVSGPLNTQENRIKRGFWASSALRLKQASVEVESGVLYVSRDRMSPAIHCFMGPIAAVP